MCLRLWSRGPDWEGAEWQNSADPWGVCRGRQSWRNKERGQVEKHTKELVVCRTEPVSTLVWPSSVAEHCSLSYLWIFFSLKLSLFICTLSHGFVRQSRPGIQAGLVGGQRGCAGTERIRECVCACGPGECSLCVTALANCYFCQPERRKGSQLYMSGLYMCVYVRPV